MINTACFIYEPKKKGQIQEISKENLYKYSFLKDDRIFKMSYSQLVKKQEFKFKELSKGIFYRKIDPNNKSIIIFVNKTLKDFEKLCKKNNWPFREPEIKETSVKKANSKSSTVKPKNTPVKKEDLYEKCLKQIKDGKYEINIKNGWYFTWDPDGDGVDLRKNEKIGLISIAVDDDTDFPNDANYLLNNGDDYDEWDGQDEIPKEYFELGKKLKADLCSSQTNSEDVKTLVKLFETLKNITKKSGMTYTAIYNDNSCCANRGMGNDTKTKLTLTVSPTIKTMNLDTQALLKAWLYKYEQNLFDESEGLEDIAREVLENNNNDLKSTIKNLTSKKWLEDELYGIDIGGGDPFIEKVKNPQGKIIFDMGDFDEIEEEDY